MGVLHQPVPIVNSVQLNGCAFLTKGITMIASVPTPRLHDAELLDPVGTLRRLAESGGAK